MVKGSDAWSLVKSKMHKTIIFHIVTYCSRYRMFGKKTLRKIGIGSNERL